MNKDTKASALVGSGPGCHGTVGRVGGREHHALPHVCPKSRKPPAGTDIASFLYRRRRSPPPPETAGISRAGPRRRRAQHKAAIVRLSHGFPQLERVQLPPPLGVFLPLLL